MAYISRKFSNIIFKKNKAFKPWQYTSTSSNNTGSKTLYKGGYKTGSIDRSKIRCYSCNDLGHFANKCKNLKQVKIDKDYLEIEAKYKSLLKKKQQKAYIAEEKCWDDSENDEESIEYTNLALMANQDEPSASTSQVPIISSIKMSNVEYKMLVEKLIYEICNVHTSMTTANEEIQKLSASNSKLINRNEHLELMFVNIEALK